MQSVTCVRVKTQESVFQVITQCSGGWRLYCLSNSGTFLWRWMSRTSTQHIHPSSRSWCRHLLPFPQNHWNLQSDWVCVLLWASEHEIGVWVSQPLCVSELGSGGGCRWPGTDRHNKPGAVGYTASVSASYVTNQSLNSQMDPANQMPGSFSGGDSDISIRASTVTRLLHLSAALELLWSWRNSQAGTHPEFRNLVLSSSRRAGCCFTQNTESDREHHFWRIFETLHERYYCFNTGSKEERVGSHLHVQP